MYSNPDDGSSMIPLQDCISQVRGPQYEEDKFFEDPLI
jgi:hypothetical protein